ncbi:MAG TPA: alpha/beta hydrolase [Dehalococcoidia bacterium]|nr:alpha/beta hydrolase [Dehalococcoidia bacterium]
MANAVKSGYVRHGDNMLNYLEWGDESLPPLLLIHGLTGFAYSWRAVAERLSDHYRCIAMNLRGHGDSGPSPEREYSFPLHVTDVQKLLGELGIGELPIVGHSLGGRVAIAYAAAHPERTKAIVVVDIAPGMTDEGAWGIKRGMDNTPAEFDSWEDALAFASRMRPRELVEERAAYIFRYLPSGKIAWKYDPLVREEWQGQDLPPRARTHLWQELAAIRCPMLLIKGQDTNQLTPELCEQMVQNGPQSRWLEIPGTTHFVQDDNLEGFLTEVEPFLAQVAGATARPNVAR